MRLAWRFAALGLSLALAACSAGGVPIEDDAPAEPGIEGEVTQALEAPQLVASTTNVDIGAVRLGSSRGALVTLRNVGRSGATVTGAVIIAPDPYHNPSGLHLPPTRSGRAHCEREISTARRRPSRSARA